MTPERARWLLSNTVCFGLRFAFLKPETTYDVVHLDGITETEDNFIKQVWSLMSDDTSYWNALEEIAKG